MSSHALGANANVGREPSWLMQYHDLCMHQRSQLSRIVRETHAFHAELTLTRLPSLFSRLRQVQCLRGRGEGACSLARVAVLTLPHSNAEEERVFSLITKNKTKFRPNLKLNGTLSSILTIKLANTEPCHKYEPTKEVLETAKKATVEYNTAHSSKK